MKTSLLLLALAAPAAAADEIACVAKIELPAKGGEAKKTETVPFRRISASNEEDEIHARNYAAYLVRVEADTLAVTIIDQSNGAQSVAWREKIWPGPTLEAVAMSQTGGRSLTVNCMLAPAAKP
jgi:hypothetical protein